MFFYITKLLESQAFGRCLGLVTGRARDLCQKPWRLAIIDDIKSLPPNWSLPLTIIKLAALLNERRMLSPGRSSPLGIPDLPEHWVLAQSKSKGPSDLPVCKVQTLTRADNPRCDIPINH